MNIQKYILTDSSAAEDTSFSLLPPSGIFDWWDTNVTNEIYISTHRRDWWNSCRVVAEQLADCERIIDVGVGDGHTFWQIISVASKLDIYQVKELALLEPSAQGLQRAAYRCSQLPVGSITLYQGIFKQFMDAWDTDPAAIGAPKQYDALYAGHVNYYLGKQGIADEKETYFSSLNSIMKLARKAIIMTVPRESDYYKTVPNPFGEYVYTDVVTDHYLSQGYKVEVLDTPMRFYVDHINDSKHEAIMLWKFFSNTEQQPSDEQLQEFISNVNEIKDNEGNINFKDQIVVITGEASSRPIGS
ncbi:MAG: hypothetical protein JWN64_804 [Parcubacteria group bacterium]|nr:hypothetical protein [Parcubacteria group bacterium]